MALQSRDRLPFLARLCVATRLGSVLRTADTLGKCEKTSARFGGDEFVILLDGLKDVSGAFRVEPKSGTHEKVNEEHSDALMHCWLRQTDTQML